MDSAEDLKTQLAQARFDLSEAKSKAVRLEERIKKLTDPNAQDERRHQLAILVYLLSGPGVSADDIRSVINMLNFIGGTPERLQKLLSETTPLRASPERLATSSEKFMAQEYERWDEGRSEWAPFRK